MVDENYALINRETGKEEFVCKSLPSALATLSMYNEVLDNELEEAGSGSSVVEIFPTPDETQH